MSGALFSPCCLTWGQTMVEVDNGDLFQKFPWIQCQTQCPQPCSRVPLTHASWTLVGKSGSVSCGVTHCSFLLGLGAHKVLFVPSKSLFSQSCVSSGGSMVGLMVTSSLCHTRVCCTQSLCPCSRPLLTHIIYITYTIYITGILCMCSSI